MGKGQQRGRGHGGNKNKSVGNNPALSAGRYFPALLISCETGNERKAKAELKDLLSYHLGLILDGDEDADGGGGGDDKTVKDVKKVLSLDDELAQLKAESQSERKKKGGAHGVDIVEGKRACCERERVREGTFR